MNQADYMTAKLKLLERITVACERLAEATDDISNTLALIEERTGDPPLSDEACKAVQLAQQIQDALAPGSELAKTQGSNAVFNLAGDIQNALARFTDQ